MYEYLHMIIAFFIDVLEGDPRWNSWWCPMIDHWKGSIVMLNLNFQNDLKKKLNQYNYDKYQVKHSYV